MAECGLLLADNSAPTAQSRPPATKGTMVVGDQPGQRDGPDTGSAGGFQDTKGRFRLALTQVGRADRLGRLVVGLTLALAWLSLAALPEVRTKPAGWNGAVAQGGQASVINLALELFQPRGHLSTACLPQAP